MILAASAFLAMCVATDGDSLSCRFPGAEADTRVRVAGIDAPELHHWRCYAELELARAAHLFVIDFLEDGPVEITPTGKPEKWRRTLAHVRHPVRGDLGQALVRAGLARVWTGRREGWCG